MRSKAIFSIEERFTLLRRIPSILMLALAIRTSGQERAPGLIFQPGSVPFVSSHASTLVELKGGMLMAAWFGGTGRAIRMWQYGARVRVPRSRLPGRLR